MGPLALAQTIERAFSDVAYPGDSALVSGCDPESEEVAAVFKGHHWKEMRVNILQPQSEAIFFFTPEAYHFFLPAYLLAMVSDIEEADTIVGSVIFSLLAEGPFAASAEGRIALLSSEQRAAVRAVLEFAKQQQGDPSGDIDSVLKTM